ncbi:hypothetical protein PINS_up012150 [Pythium insidiosum]|nr:hypothetical protein PINS_up012150 [Pythium insidiosum]
MPSSLEPPPTQLETQELMPPPAPSAPLFIGSLVTEKDTTGDDDSDSDDDDAEGDTAPPPPLNLPVVHDDDDEELEVDPEVSKEILSAAKRETTTATRAPEQHENALLAALESSAPVNEFSAFDDVPTTERFDNADDSEIKLSVVAEDAVDDDAKERRAPHPESSEGVFGIAYKSLKKAPRRDTGVVKDSYSVGASSRFAELESELTLSSDASLSGRPSVGISSQRVVEQEEDEDDDEFASSTGAASPSRVNAFLEQLPARRHHAEEEAERDLVVQMKRATEAEKSQLTESDAVKAPRETDTENAITLKELHSIYKRGLGDQEVRMMDEAQENEAMITKTEAATVPAMSVMGRLLNGATGVRATPIVEEEEDENEDERASLSGAGDDERLQLVDERGTDNDDDGRGTEAPTADEWLEIQLLRKASMSQPKAEFDANDDSSDAVRPPSPLPSPSRAPSVAVTRITYAAALQFVLEDESLLDARDRIVVEELAAPSSCFTCFSRPRLAFPDAQHERERLFCAAATAFDARNTTFVAMLQTVFRQLTRAPRDVPLSGTHWEQIGFQGNDPATDLRGCGVLSLLQMLFLVERHDALAQRCLRASHHATRHFPLACALINVTLQCLLALRSGALFKECNAQRSVFQGVNAVRTDFSLCIYIVSN